MTPPSGRCGKCGGQENSLVHHGKRFNKLYDHAFVASEYAGHMCDEVGKSCSEIMLHGKCLCPCVLCRVSRHRPTAPREQEAEAKCGDSRCGHPRKNHSRFSDHDECGLCNGDFQCDQYIGEWEPPTPSAPTALKALDALWVIVHEEGCDMKALPQLCWRDKIPAEVVRISDCAGDCHVVRYIPEEGS